MRIILESSGNITEIFENYFEKFQKNLENYSLEFREVFYKISRNIFENFENGIVKFRKSYQKISEDFEKYFRHF